MAEVKDISGLKCCKCERPVRPTVHFAGRVVVDYYVLKWMIGRSPVVECADCYSPQKEKVS